MNDKATFLEFVNALRYGQSATMLCRVSKYDELPIKIFSKLIESIMKKRIFVSLLGIDAKLLEDGCYIVMTFSTSEFMQCVFDADDLLSEIERRLSPNIGKVYEIKYSIL